MSLFAEFRRRHVYKVGASRLLDSVEDDEREADICFDDAVNHWNTQPEIQAMLERQRDGARQRHEAIKSMRERLDALH